MCNKTMQSSLSELDKEYLRQVDLDWEMYENEMELDIRDRVRYERANKVVYNA